jgi:DNA-binding SARP family transcriptional activator
MASATLRIRLLGELDLRHGEVPVPPLGSARAESLLAYLLLHRDAAQPRQRLAFLLWPDSSEPQARTNLRHLLHNLRRALPDPDRFLEVTQRTLRWRDEAPWWLDVAAFEGAVARAEQAGRAVPAPQEAVELYGGDLLQSSYDEWLLEERERLRRGYLGPGAAGRAARGRARPRRGDRVRGAAPARGPAAGGDPPAPYAAARRPR